MRDLTIKDTGNDYFDIHDNGTCVGVLHRTAPGVWWLSLPHHLMRKAGSGKEMFRSRNAALTWLADLIDL